MVKEKAGFFERVFEGCGPCGAHGSFGRTDWSAVSLSESGLHFLGPLQHRAILQGDTVRLEHDLHQGENGDVLAEGRETGEVRLRVVRQQVNFKAEA